MSRNKIVILLILLVFAIGTPFLIDYYKKKKVKKEYVFERRNRKNNKFLHKIYVLLSEFPLTAGYIKKIHQLLSLIEPEDILAVERESMSMFFRIIGISGLVFVIIMSIFPSMKMLVVCIICIYAVSNYIVYDRINTLELQLITQLKTFISQVRHYYYISWNVEEALQNSLEETKAPLNQHIKRILEIIEEEGKEDNNSEDKIMEYMKVLPSYLIRMLLSNIMTICRFDDKKEGGVSLFIQNLDVLHENIDLEIQNRIKTHHKLKGREIMAIIPLLTLDFFEKVLTEGMPEMASFYKGGQGLIVMVILCIISIVCYKIFSYLKDVGEHLPPEHSYLRKLEEVPIIHKALEIYWRANYGKSLKINKLLQKIGENLTAELYLLQKCCYAISCFVLSIALIVAVHWIVRNDILNSTQVFNGLSMTVQEEGALEGIEEETLSLSRELKRAKEIESISFIDLIDEPIVKNNSAYLKIVEDEVKVRVNQYQNEFMKYWEFLICIGLGYLGFFIPDLVLYVKKQGLKDTMDNEVIQFQSIIVMMMHINRVSSRDILTWLEHFSVIFHEPIRECVDSIDYDEEQALALLREKAQYPPFEKIIDDMIMVDRVGIEQAFNEVAAERMTALKYREISNEMTIDKKSGIADTLTLVPTLATMILYVFYPTVMVVLQQINIMYSMFEGI